MSRGTDCLFVVAILCFLTVARSVDVTSLTCNTDKTIDLTVTGAESYYVSIVGCAEEQQISGGTATLSTCSLTWNTQYVVQIYENPNVYMASDYSTTISCSRRITNITVSFTDRSFRPTVGVDPTDGTVTDLVEPVVDMSITTDSAGTTSAGTVAVGTTLYLNLELQSAFTGADGFDIRAKKITVSSAGTTVTLTGDSTDGDGCMSQSYWGAVNDMGQGSLQVQFTAFMIVTGTSAVNTQVFTAYLEVCDGTACSAYTCGGMARRKRTIDEEETEAADILEDVEASGELLVLRVPINNGGSDSGQDGSPEGTLCVQKTSFYGISVFFLVALLLCVAATCVMFFRVRRTKLRKAERDMREFGSLNTSKVLMIE